MFRRLLGLLGYEPTRKPEPESVRQLKRMAEQLNEKASRFRTVASRAVLTEQRLEQLETDLVTWERRARVVAGRAELSGDAQRICGRIEGQLQELRGELTLLNADEAHLRALLTSGREEFARLVQATCDLGHDVSGCLLYVDLTRPERVADTELLADDEREFIGRVIDSTGVH